MDAIRGFNQVGTPRDIPGGPIDDRLTPDAGEDLEAFTGFADAARSPVQNPVDPPGGWRHGLDGIDSYLVAEAGFPLADLQAPGPIGDGVDLPPVTGEVELYGLEYVAGAHPLDGVDSLDGWAAVEQLQLGTEPADLAGPPLFPYYGPGAVLDGVDVVMFDDVGGLSPIGWGPPSWPRAGLDGDSEVLFDGVDPDARLALASSAELAASETHEFDGADLGAVVDEQGQFWGASLPPYLFGDARFGDDQLDSALPAWVSLPEDAAVVDGFDSGFDSGFGATPSV